MYSFVHQLNKFHHLTALEFEYEKPVSYGQLIKEMDTFAQKLIGNRQLVLIEARRNYETIIAYLACLKYHHCVLIIESELNESAKKQLIDTYQPNWQYKDHKNGYQLNHLRKKAHTLHPDLALLLSTSGSTGSPKLVKLSLRNLQSNAHAITLYLGIKQQDITITSLPLSYSYGLSVINSHLLVGASIVVTNQSIMTRAFWNIFQKKQVSSLAGVPYIYEMLIKLKFTQMNLPHLKTLTQAGGKLSEDLVQTLVHYAQEKNIKFFIMYGQTEATARMSYLSPEKALTKPHSIGQAIPGGQLWLEDKEGNIITKTQQIGELFYSGNNVMLGYANHLKELADADSLLGQLPTGDLGFFDSDGDFSITGRQSRFIKIYGNRVGLDEIEAYLLSYQIRGTVLGRDNLLYIISEEKLNETKLLHLIKKRYGFNKNTIKIISNYPLPRSSSGKILMSELMQSIHSINTL